VTVAAERAEEARAAMAELHPEGFEERESARAVELAAYTDEAGEARLRRAFGAVAVEEVEPGWEERWREFHRPVQVGPLWIGPPWEAAPADALTVTIEPARAFGTGAHPTTRLCLELLLELGRGSLLDVGCGSGILSAAAARLGFEPVRSVDVDPEAVEETRRNAAANGVVVEARVADALRDDLPAADVVVANVALAAVEALAPRLTCRVLVSSGYLRRDRLALEGWRHVERRERDGWAADVYERA
jgi:ribosomal protein L11 methyltransferase